MLKSRLKTTIKWGFLDSEVGRKHQFLPFNTIFSRAMDVLFHCEAHSGSNEAWISRLPRLGGDWLTRQEDNLQFFGSI